MKQLQTHFIKNVLVFLKETMNLTIILLFVITLAFIQVIAGSDVESTKESLIEWDQECITETEVDVQLLIDEAVGAYIDDPKVKCYHACMMKKVGFMSDDGTVDKEKMNNYMPAEVIENKRERLKELRPRCIEMTGENACETAFLIKNCIRRRFKIGSGPYDEHSTAKLAKLMVECQHETGADPSLINFSLQGGKISHPKVKCWHACFDKKLKFMSADNVVNKTKITNFIRYFISVEYKKSIREHQAKCAELVGENECETSYLIYWCIQEVLSSYEKIKKSQSAQEQCRRETGADSALIESVQKYEVVDDQKVKCYIACMFKRSNKISEDGIINKNIIINSFLSALPILGIRGILRQSVSECAEKTGKDNCETAYLIFTCLQLVTKNYNEMNKNRQLKSKPRLAACAANVNPEYLAAEAIDKVARDPGVKCYYACVYEKFGYMLEDGTIMKQIILDKMPTYFPRYKRQMIDQKLLTKCIDLSGEDKCDTAFLIDKCVDSLTQQIKTQMELKCQNKSHVDSENSESENGGKKIDRPKCYHACMFEEYGWMAEDGTVMKDKIINFNFGIVPEKKKNQVQQPLIQCTELTGEDKCDTAALIFNCTNSIMIGLLKQGII